MINYYRDWLEILHLIFSLTPQAKGSHTFEMKYSFLTCRLLLSRAHLRAFHSWICLHCSNRKYTDTRVTCDLSQSCLCHRSMFPVAAWSQACSRWKCWERGTCGVLLYFSAPLTVRGCAVALPCSQWVIRLLHHPLSQQPNVVWACGMQHTGLPGQPWIQTAFSGSCLPLRRGKAWRKLFSKWFLICET